MNVGELKERLDEFGDHVPVAVVVEAGASEKVHRQYDVDDRTIDGEIVVTLTIEQ